jgi:arylsulfatase A-like enzyme
LAALLLLGPLLWLLVLLADGLSGGLGRAESFLIVLVGLRQALLVCVGASLFALLAHRSYKRRWLLWAISLLVLFAPCLDQAAFLASGDRIASHPLVLPIRVALTAALLVAWAVTLEWLRRGLAFDLQGRARWSWLGIGCLAALGLARLVRFELEAYAYFGAFAGFMLATFVMGLALAFRGSIRSLALCLGLDTLIVLAAFTLEPADVAATSLDRAPLASLARAALGPRAPTLVASLDFSEPARFRCRAEREQPAREWRERPEAQRRNVILISIDALRADMLHQLEDGRAVMPALASFSARSLEFTQAFSSYPATIYALGSAFTGYSPSQLLLSPTLPRSLFRRIEGRFDAIEIVLPNSNWFKLDAIDSLLLQNTKPTRAANAREQTDIAMQRLDAARARHERTFLWVHYLEPHGPYERHDGFDFGTGRRASYLSEVAFVDRELSRLLEHLEREGWLEDSLVMVFADHGESLGERKYWGHHVYLNAAIIDVPLLLHYPGVTPRSVSDLVEIGDITPTVLDFAGLPLPTDIEARSLFATLRQPGARGSVAEAFPVRGKQLFALANEAIVSVDDLRNRVDGIYERGAKSYDPKVSLVRDGYRLIVNRRTGSHELFERLGPSQERGVPVSDRAALLHQMEGELVDWHERQAERIYCRVLAHTP